MLYFCKSQLILFLLLAVIVSCTKEVKPIDVKISSHDLREDGFVLFKISVHNPNSERVFLMEPRAGKASHEMEPFAFCIANDSKKDLEDIDSFSKALAAFKKGIRFWEIPPKSLGAMSRDFLEIAPGEKKELDSLLYLPEGRVDPGEHFAKCYYHFSKEKIDLANSTEARNFLMKMNPMTLETPIYKFTVPKKK